MTETPWARELTRLRANGARLWDLTASNPTRCGFAYAAEPTLSPLLQPAALLYDPDPKGLQIAREAVCLYYRDHGANVDPNQVLLTTSTSEAYSFLFRLLCDPGDQVLAGQPGYPLFDFLAQLDDVRLDNYLLFYDHGWHLDLSSLQARIHPRTRAIVVVHPNNPTGHFTSSGERAALEEICIKHSLALIVDEVFLDYGLPGQEGQSFTLGPHPVPTFVLSGLSKVAALPQMKVAWVVCFAPLDGLQRLEVISDTFLSLSGPMQWSLSSWLSARAVLQQQIRERVAGNLVALDRLIGGQTLINRLQVDAGWYAVLRIPALEAEEKTALDLLHAWGVIVHTGGFFGFSGQGWLVVSLLGSVQEFAEGVARVLEHFQQ